jgi:hypothetical protein
MFKSLALASSLLVTAAGAASAQTTDSTGSAVTQAPAPVVRTYQANPAPPAPPMPPAPPAPPMAPDANQGAYSQSGQGPGQGQGPWDSRGPMVRRGRYRQDDGQEAMQRPAPIQDSQPVAGVWLRSRSTAVVRTISATPQGTEIKVEKGVLNVSVHHPSQHIAILVDLPGGQTSLLKDGLYTFNADTNTVRVLRGEAAAFPSGLKTVSTDAKGRDKGIKVKEDHQLSFVASTVPGADRIKAVEAYPYELGTDLLPASGDGRQYANVSGEDGPYGYGYAGGYPYGYYPGFYPGWGYGYPYGYGIGIGYYGGFGGGFRGGYRGGFRR